MSTVQRRLYAAIRGVRFPETRLLAQCGLCFLMKMELSLDFVSKSGHKR